MKLFKISYILFATIILLISYSCQQDSVIDQPSELPYLSLPDNVDFENLSNEEMQIIMNAFDRIGLYETEDGLYDIKARAYWEINVSENIYLYFNRMIIDMNNRIVSTTVISRSGMLSNGESQSDYQNDCLARAISAAKGQLGYADISAWITQNYGTDGVDLSDVDEIMSHFGASKRQGINNFNTGTTFPNNSCVMIYIENNNAHAVNAQFVGTGAVLYRDFQANQSTGQVGGISNENIWGMYVF